MQMRLHAVVHLAIIFHLHHLKAAAPSIKCETPKRATRQWQISDTHAIKNALIRSAYILFAFFQYLMRNVIKHYFTCMLKE